MVPLTTVEWEGKLAAVLFGQGCPWRCRYCHNTSLVPADGKLTPWEDVMAFLQDRVGLIDGVVFSGGEPTAQAALLPAMREVADLGFALALHTNGGQPKLLQELLDAGLPQLHRHGRKGAVRPLRPDHAGARQRAPRPSQSVSAIIKSGVDYEFRTTYPLGSVE